MSEFKIGDRVEIVNNGKSYTTYEEFIYEYTPQYLELYRLRKCPSNGMIGIIEYIGKHHEMDRDLAIIKSNEYIYIIGLDGLKCISIPFNLQDFKSGKFAVNCETEREAEEFILKVKNLGIDVYLMYPDSRFGYMGLTTYYVDGCLIGMFYDIDIPKYKYSELNFKENKTMNYTEKMKEIEIKQRELADEMAALKKEMEKTGYYKPVYGEDYHTVEICDCGINVETYEWRDDSNDNDFYDYGNIFHTESEAQRIADMLNYFFFVQKKAREINGLLGYGHDVEDGWVIFYGNFEMDFTECIKYSQHHNPLQSIMTKECAEILVKDPEIIKAAKLAWGVK